MSKSSRLIVTALPHFDSESPDMLRISVMLSPQLPMRGDRVRLKPHFPEIHHWPRFAKVFEHLIRFRIFAFDNQWNKVGQTMPLQGSVHNRSWPLAAPSSALELWQRMLPGDTPVSHWQDTDVAFDLADVLTRRKMEELTRAVLLKEKQDILKRELEELPINDDEEARERAGSLVSTIDQLLDLPIESLLTNPFVLQHNGLRETLRSLQSGFHQEMDHLFLRLDLTDVYERNVSETREFHKRFSAYGQHPELLRRTGWLWEYELDPQQDAPLEHPDGNTKSLDDLLRGWQQAGHRIFIKVDEEPFQLSSETSLSESEYGVFGLGPTRVRYLDLLTGNRMQEANRSDSLRKALAEKEAFYLGFLNEINVYCTMSAVEGAITKEDCPVPGVLQWRVAPRQVLVPGTTPAVPASNTDGSLFAEFREYVPVNDPRFTIHARLVDRKQLFRRIEELVLRPDGESKSVGPSSYEELRTLALDSTARPESQRNGYTSNGITVTIDNLATLLSTATQQNPLAQREEVKQVVIDASANVSDLNTAGQIAALLDSTVLLYQHNVHQGYRIDVIACGPPHKNGQASAVPVQPCLLAGSLCEKSEAYVIAGGGIMGTASQLEGWVSEPAQLRNDGKLYVEDELFHWNDWNLVVPLDGQPADNEAIADADDHALSIVSTVEDATQVPLRLLWNYSFALRPVDIAGNSAPAINQRLAVGGDWYNHASRFRNFLEGKPMPAAGNSSDCPVVQRIFTPPITYQRVEGVHQPRLFHYKRNPRVQGRTPAISPADPAVDLTTFVVRSCYDVATRTLQAEEIDDVRMLAPPRISLTLMFQHGVLDELLYGVNAVTASEREALLDELLKLDAIPWQEPSDAPAEAMDDDTQINYLFDPLADGFDILLDRVIYPVPIGYAPRHDRDRYWRRGRYHRVALRTASARQQTEEISLRFAVEPDAPPVTALETVFVLRRGFSHEVSLGCRLKPTFGGVDTREVFLRGVTPVYFSALSRPRIWDESTQDPDGAPVTFLHAVEKPCLLYAHYNARCAMAVHERRSMGSDRGWVAEWKLQPDPSCTIALPVTPTDFLEEIPCRRLELPDRAPLQKEQLLHLFFAEFPVLTAETYLLHATTISVECDRRSRLGVRLVTTQQVVQNGITPVRKGAGPTDRARELDVEFRDLRHTLPDTRYYRVGYEVEAVSKFAQYFNDIRRDTDPRPHSVSGYVYQPLNRLDSLATLTPRPDEKSCSPEVYADWLNGTYFKVPTADQGLLPVASTAKPAEPVIEKIVPLMRWSRQTSKGVTTVERRCDTVRLYFAGDWYSSGWGEQVAILFYPPPAAPTSGPDSIWQREFSSADSVRFSKRGQDYKDQSLSQLISQFGTDPIFTQHGIEHGVPAAVGHHIDEQFFPGSLPGEGPVRIRDLEWENLPYSDNSVSPADELRELSLHYVLYPVRFRSAQELNREAGSETFTEGRFYVDVRLNSARLEKHYFPFVRLAVARFQPHGIRPATRDGVTERYRFSKVLMTDFFQPLPYRRLSFRQKEDHIEILWDGGNQTRQPVTPAVPGTGKTYDNRIVCYRQCVQTASEPPDSMAVPDKRRHALFRLEGAEENEERNIDRFPFAAPLRPVYGTDVLLTVPWAAAGIPPYMPRVLTVAEYEYHANDELTGTTGGSSDPRQDPRNRLVFSYVHHWLPS